MHLNIQKAAKQVMPTDAKQEPPHGESVVPLRVKARSNSQATHLIQATIYE